MNFYLPQFRAVFMAENANLTMHNLLPARGALVRDAKAWADYLTEVDPPVRRPERRHVRRARHSALRPARNRRFLTSHRDAYKFLHDQTVRLMNTGLTGTEIAEVLDAAGGAGAAMVQSRLLRHDEPQLEGRLSALPRLVRRQSGQSHPLPPEPAAKRYVEAMGGADAVLALAQGRIDAGELRWAAMLLNHVVFADATNKAAREQLAASTPQLGFEPRRAPGATST